MSQGHHTPVPCGMRNASTECNVEYSAWDLPSCDFPHLTSWGPNLACFPTCYAACSQRRACPPIPSPSQCPRPPSIHTHTTSAHLKSTPKHHKTPQTSSSWSFLVSPFPQLPQHASATIACIPQRMITPTCYICMFSTRRAHLSVRSAPSGWWVPFPCLFFLLTISHFLRHT